MKSLIKPLDWPVRIKHTRDALKINFSPSPKCKKPTTFVVGFGSLCWARTSDPLINSQML